MSSFSWKVTILASVSAGLVALHAALMARAEDGDARSRERTAAEWIQLLEDPDARVRKEAVDSLAVMGVADEWAAISLIGALDDLDEDVRRAASRGIFRARAEWWDQDPAGWVTAGLLAHPAKRIERDSGGLALFARPLVYRFEATTERWHVERSDTGRSGSAFPNARGDTLGSTEPFPADAAYSFGGRRGKAPYRLWTTAIEDTVCLGIARESPAGAETLGVLRLWDNQDLVRVYGIESNVLAEGQDYGSSGVEVSDVFDDGASLWVGTRFYAGEGGLGIGSLARFDLQSRRARVYKSTLLDRSSISHVAVAGGAAWIGTYHYGECNISATSGLVRVDPSTGDFRSYLPATRPIAGALVTALDVEGDTLWIATDEGINRAVFPAERWTSWRIVPCVETREPVSLSDSPGGPRRALLPPGRHEVRWAKPGYMEVATSDSTEGWLSMDWYATMVERGFEKSVWQLMNTYDGPPNGMPLLVEPREGAARAGLVYRADLDSISTSNDGNWVRIRSKVGWIDRAGLKVAVEIRAVE